MREYDKKKKHNYEHTLLKVLYRCSLAYRSRERIKKIFKMSKQSQVLKDEFQERSHKLVVKRDHKETQAQKAEREEVLAKFCLSQSRLHIQISQFLDESGYFRGQTFKMNKKDF